MRAVKIEDLLRHVVMMTVLTLALLCSGCIYPPGLRGNSGPQVEVENTNGVDEIRVGHGWRYLPMEQTVCANGTSAGLGLSRNSETELVIYLNGGGACWDAASCNLFRTAANLDVTYDAQRLGEELHPLVEAGLFDRRAEVNPFPQASYAFIPYCTADLHGGRTQTEYSSFAGGKTIHHRGADNLYYYLQALRRDFPNVERLWLVGISAGGYGLTWNFHHFRQAFADAQINVFFDASPWLRIETDKWEEWQQNWQMERPNGCVMCDVAPDHLIRYLVEAYPETRFAMSTFNRDAVLAGFLRVLPGEVETSLNWFLEERFYGQNTSAFVAQGSDHEALLRLNEDLRSINGTTIAEFFRQWALGEQEALE